MNRQHRQSRLATSISIWLLFTALVTANCSTDGNGGSNDDSSPPANSDNFVNGPLRGSIVYDAKVLDLETGNVRELDLDNRFRTIRPRISANAVGSEFYTIDKQCRQNTPHVFRIDCIVSYDNEGNRLRSVDTGVNLHDDLAPIISHDGSAFMVRTDLIDEDFDRLMMVPTDAFPANFERKYPEFSFVASKPDWSPANQAYYMRGRTIYRTIGRLVPEALDQPVIEFDDGNGIPSALSISPDGTQIAVARQTGSTLASTSGSIWIMDIDGSNLRQFIATESEQGARTPVWSPDGRWVIADISRVRGVTGIEGDGLVSSASGALIAFDTAVDKHVVPVGNAIDGVTQIRVKRCIRPAVEGCPVGTRLGNLPSETVTTWFQ